MPGMMCSALHPAHFYSRGRARLLSMCELHKTPAADEQRLLESVLS